MAYGNYPDLTGCKRVLVVKMRHHGDVLLTSPFFCNLAKAMPRARIEAFIYADTLPMLEGHPAISGWILYERGWKQLAFFRKLFKEFSILWRIYRGQYDLVVNLTEGDRGALAALVSRARYRIGFDPGKKGKRKCYTHLVKHCSTSRHAVERQLDVLRRMGVFPTEQERDLFIHIPPHALHKMQSLLGSQSYIVIHPVSRWRFKCLSTQQIAHLIALLHDRGERVVLSSGPDVAEVAMIDEIIRLVPTVPIINVAGTITLKELAALLTRSRALISVDSVPVHIASAVKTPVVALFGPTSEKNWGPWMHPRARVIAQHFPCRPCYQDGCGGSKKSDCLLSIDPRVIVDALDAVLQPEVFTKVGRSSLLTL